MAANGFSEIVVPDDSRIVAVGLLTGQDLERLGAGFTRAWPVDDTSCFSDLLMAIDEADRALWRDRDAGEEPRQIIPNPQAR